MKNDIILSDETRQVLKEILIKIEHLRNRANKKNDFPPSDHSFRHCQSIIATKLGFENRNEWHTDKYLGFETKL